MSDAHRQPGDEVLERSETREDRPPLYLVILHNDDYTTMEFVIEILEGVFHKSPAEAFRIMLHVHGAGRGVCGAYPHEVAETKVAQVHSQSRERGFPLLASLEPE